MEKFYQPPHRPLMSGAAQGNIHVALISEGTNENIVENKMNTVSVVTGTTPFNFLFALRWINRSDEEYSTDQTAAAVILKAVKNLYDPSLRSG